MTDKITIRPSSIDTFVQCPQQWYRVFIEGGISIPNSRAAIGTAIHRGIEELWTDSMQVNSKVTAMSTITDAAMDAWKEEEQKGMRYDKDETDGTCAVEIVKGLDAFVEDILPWVDIPTGVEKRYTVNIEDHPVVEAISGSLDYVHEGIGVISDVKTGKRKHNTSNSETQQSIYRWLVEQNGVNVNVSTIQNVVLKTKPDGHVMEASINLPKAKAIVNTLLDVLNIYDQDIVDPELLFRGNPKYYLCSPKYCAFHSTCKYVGNGK